MSNSDKNRALGLSASELNSAVLNSGDAASIENLQDKIDNCDLSSSAIELVNEEDLEAIARISESVNIKYLGIRSVNWIKIILALGIGGIGLLVFMFTGTSEPDQVGNNPVISDQNEPVVVNADSVVEKEVAEMNTATGLVDNMLEVDEVVEAVVFDSLDDAFAIEDTTVTILDPIIKDEIIISKKKVVTEVKSQPSTKKGRRVRGVKANEGVIPEKHKGESYSFSDLIDYNGGVKRMEKDLFAMLIGKVNDSDIPSKHSTIVFNFNVTHRGKVKDVSIQSVVSPELEVLLNEAVLSLSDWSKGSKRISKNYTVYVTFK